MFMWLECVIEFELAAART